MSTILKNNSGNRCARPGGRAASGSGFCKSCWRRSSPAARISKLAGDPVMVDMFADIETVSGSGTWSERWRSREGLDFYDPARLASLGWRHC